jgi:hypothetical protein
MSAKAFAVARDEDNVDGKVTVLDFECGPKVNNKWETLLVYEFDIPGQDT